MVQLVTTACTAQIMKEISCTLELVSDSQSERLMNRLMQAKAIYVAGSGRSGLMMRAFAMRLMHLGRSVYVVGETVTPGIAAGDLLLIGSGSGETKSLVTMAGKAKAVGADVALITIVPESAIGQYADVVVQIPARTKDAADEHTTIQPMGSLFEQSLLLLLDAYILRAMALQQLNAAAMFNRHANLE